MNSEELMNRAFSALKRDVRLTYPGQNRNQITFWFSDDTFFGLLRGKNNFEMTLKRDLYDSKEFIHLTVILLNDKSIFEKRCHVSYIVPKLRSNRSFSIASLYSRGIIGSNQDFIYDD